MVKGDKFSKAQCPQNDKEKDEIKNVPYAALVGNLMYSQVFTCPDIVFVVGVFGRYLSDYGFSHSKVANKFMRYLQGTKDVMLTYQRADTLDIVGFSDADYAGCVDDKIFTLGYIYIMVRGSVSWKSIKKTLTASSTMEAEHMAC
ncbi:secreted RxLR effector protein 161-like [Humulus lupulus]|uniref:secreted RxLR effector protein 161-like n=1 Tax=Humulus lupulus TaxID=3486 RepID=UPI002B412F1D|nr:secreted RxLR effector protein 161-like [Humulus lupulus]